MRDLPELELDDGQADVPLDVAAFLAPPQKPDEIGRLGGYRVLKLLGEGGMGYVFMAEDESLQRAVALKVMKPDVICEENAKERFFREARAAAKVRHEHVVMIHQVGEDRGIPYLALEYLEGSPLDKMLKDGGEISLKKAVRITKEIAAGLHAAHRQGLIHRDIKPANIWLEAPDERAKILDFGLARHLVEDTHLTKTGEVVGTPAFMSPEQARDHPIDQRSDLFSLGIILYRLCTGQQPFQGSTTMAILTSLAVDEPLKPSRLNPIIPIYLEEIILRLLEKLPSRRYQSAQELVEALTAIEKRPGIAPASDPVIVEPPISPPSVTVAEGERAPTVQAKTLVTKSSQANKKDAVKPNGAKPSQSWRSLLLAAGLVGFAATAGWIIVFKRDQPAYTSMYDDTGVDPVEKSRSKPRERVKNLGAEPARAIAPFEAKQAKDHQNAWAKHIGDPVEIENSIGMPLALIPPGKFQMGAPTNEPGSIKREGPQHEVEITRPFYMGVTEVTQEQFEKVMKTNPSKFKKDQGGGPNYPVEQVSWVDANIFCEELTKLPDEVLAGRVYRLPTEAEWEYACRAGSTSAYFHTTRPLGEFAWYHDNAKGKPERVQMRQPNAWGLFDMTGNVWEWCSDYYDDSYYDQKVSKDPEGPPIGSDRVWRGGCFGSPIGLCRSAYRQGMVPGFRNESLGFRICVTLE